MNINRHNYEEFFLLYVDRELSAAERKAVEVFVKENSDLQTELLLLQQAVLKADDINLDKKDWLYMEAEPSVLQESLFLYADDELSALNKKSVEELITSNDAVKAEWNIIKQTKLQPDTSIVFADKQSLYRKEGGRVVGFKWWRVAAAAVLVGFSLWSGLLLYKNYKTTTGNTIELANNNNIKTEQIKTVVPVTPVIATPPSVENNTPDQIASTAARENKNLAEVENTKKQTLKNSAEKTAVSKENLLVQNNSNNKKADNNLPKSYLENINKPESNETISATVLPENNNSKKVSGNEIAEVRTGKNENSINTINNRPGIEKTNPSVAAVQAVNKTADTESNTRYINIDDEKEKRTALGGFLRKAKRVLERTANINTGEGIKVAGFEIALK